MSSPEPAGARSFPPELIVAVKAIACELPHTLGLPLSRLHVPDIRAEIIARGIDGVPSCATIWRWLDADAIRPWTHRSWIFPRDPDFEAKAGVVLDLYAGIWQDRPLKDDEFVICTDEKTSIQARCRCHPTLAAAPRRPVRVEHEYERRGALAYLAAWDLHHARVIGRCDPTTGIVPFSRLVEQVMTTEPYASARRVFWIADNGSSHRGQASIDRMKDAWPSARLVHLPVHASWLNQAEIYFSVVQRKVLTPNDFHDLAEIEAALLGFERRYETAARPFEWKFTRSDLTLLVKRLAGKPDLKTAA